MKQNDILKRYHSEVKQFINDGDLNVVNYLTIEDCETDFTDVLFISDKTHGATILIVNQRKGNAGPKLNGHTNMNCKYIYMYSRSLRKLKSLNFKTLEILYGSKN